MTDQDPDRDQELDPVGEIAPFFGSWRATYAATLSLLAFYVVAMYLFRLSFS